MATLMVNGVASVVDAPEQTPLLDILRHELGLTSARLGCGLGQCGACHGWWCMAVLSWWTVS